MAKEVPCAQETEGSVLGAILNEGEVYWSLLMKMTNESPHDLFYTPEYRMLSLAIEKVVRSENGWSNSLIEDQIMLISQDSDMDAKGYLIGIQLRSSINNQADYISALKLLINKHKMRVVLNSIENLASQITNPDAELQVSDVTGELNKIAVSGTAVREIRTMADIIDELESKETAPWVVSTGLDDLDAKIGGGYQPGRTYVCAAETKIGKTTFIMNNAISALHDGVVTIFFSAETLEPEFYGKMWATEAFVNQRDVVDLVYRRKDMDSFDPEEQKYLAEARNFLRTDLLFPLFSSDITHGVMTSLIGAIMHARSIHGNVPIVLFIDYLQLLVENQLNATPEINQLTRDFKLLATEMEIPIVYLSQLNKEGMTGEMPTVRNLKGSTSISQDCDAAIMLHRKHHYDETEPEHIMDIGIPINRMGKPSQIQVFWDGAKNTIDNIDTDS